MKENNVEGFGVRLQIKRSPPHEQKSGLFTDCTTKHNTLKPRESGTYRVSKASDYLSISPRVVACGDDEDALAHGVWDHASHHP
jgi:hypothetical protein